MSETKREVLCPNILMNKRKNLDWIEMSCHDIVFRHIQDFWLESCIRKYSWNNGKIVHQLPDFFVFSVKPSNRNYWIYVSSGLSDILGQEFFIISPIETVEHIETLAMLASTSLDYPESFRLNCTINIGKPWLEQSNMSRFLISLPYLYGKELEYMDYLGKQVRFFWLLPITDGEYTYIKTNGVDSLEQLFEMKHINYLEIDRLSVV